MRRILLLNPALFLVFISTSLFGQINGPASVIVGSTHTYTFNNGSFYIDPYWQSSRGQVITSTESGTTYTVTIKWISTGNTSLSFREVNEPGPPPYYMIASKIITITSCPIITTPTVTGNYRFGAGTFTFIGVGAPAGGTYNWYNAAGSLLATGATYTTSSISATTSNYMFVKAVSVDGCLSAQTWITPTVYPVPVVTISGNTIVMDQPVVMDAGAGYDSYQWKDYFNSPLLSGTSQVYNAFAAGRFKVTVTKNGAMWTSPEFVINSQLSGQNYNYVVANNLRVRGITDASAVTNLSASANSKVIQYADGLGRPLQTVITQGSPTKKDIVQAFDYDGMGRQSTSYLPYISDEATGRIKSDPLGINTSYTTSPHAVFYNAANDKIADDTTPYATTVFDNSPLSRVLEQGAPGTDWQPGQHTVKNVFRTNAANEIRIWKSDLTSSGYYNPSTLLVSETADENNNKVITVADKAGRVLEKHVQVDGTTWLKTRNIYDDLGRLKYTLQPEGVRQLGAGTTISSTLVEQFAFTYVYDTRQRVVEKKVPGSAPVYYGYDPLDRLTLIQDGNLRAQNKWLYIKYDKYHRPVMQGIYTNTTQVTRTTVQGLLDALTYTTDELYYEKKQSGTTHGYSNQSFPTTNTQVIAVNYYDDYDLNADNVIDYSYTLQGLTNESTQAPTIGQLTASKKLVLNSSLWITSYVFYDKYGQAIQVRSNNHLSSAIDNLTTNVYNFDGSLYLTQTYHKAIVGQEVTVKQRYEYDHAGRLLKVWHKINPASGGTDVLSCAYEYNELGQLVDKKLHSVDNGSTFLQSVDYRYSIRGWLASINNSQLTIDNNNDDNNDYFGMELLYNQAESGLSNTQYYNGNISAIKWKGVGATAGVSEQKSYKYSYDKSDRLTAGAYQKSSTTGWDTETNALNETQNYDHNGNISLLTRNQHKHQLSGVIASYGSETMDNLTYTYNSTNGNSLQKVTDAALTTGFNNGNSGSGNDFTYDVNGNLTTDQNKGMSIVYNELGKAQQITFADGRVINYTFDAAGSKLKMAVTANGTTTTTDYTGGFVYENNVLKFFGSPDGRIVKNGSTFEYQYSIADHQGNTRVVFSSAAVTLTTSTANFETTTNTNFQNHTNRVNFELMDHTDVTTDGVDYSQKLTGGNGSQVGIAKSMKVYPGDKVKIEGYAKYYNAQSTQSNISGFALALTSAFGVSSASTGEALKAYNTLNNYGGIIASGGSGGSSSYPKLFVNILLFDKDFNFLDAAWQQIDGGEQIGATTKYAHDHMMQEVTVKEAGYAYVYVSNENPTLVEFYVDDVTVTQTPTNVIQYNEYYPFGLLTQNSWTRENTTGNNFLYNAGNELNTSTGNYEMFFRGYDPVLGRMLQVDPMAGKYASLTPYNYSFNDPVYWNDPSGAEPPGGQSYYNGSPVWTRDWYGGYQTNPSFSGYDLWAIENGAGSPGASLLLDGAIGERNAQNWVRNYLGINAQAGYTYSRETITGYGIMPHYQTGEEFAGNVYEYNYNIFQTQNCPSCGFADFLRNTQSFGNYPNPFYGAEAIFADAGWSFVGAEGDQGGFFILAGKDKGKFVSFKELAGGGAPDAGVGVELGRIDVSGNPSMFTSNDLFGNRDKAWASYLLVGGAYTWGATQDGRKVSSMSIQIGPSLNALEFILGGFSGGYNYGTIKPK